MQSQIEIQEVGPEALDAYAKIPIAFEVTEVLKPQLINRGLGGIIFEERPIGRPYVKDYDTAGDGPQTWPETFDISRWAFFLAYVPDDAPADGALASGGSPVGGAAVAYSTPEVRMLEGRNDLGLLWDLRVAPDYRRNGIGRALFKAAADWCRTRGCTQMKVETQNINVAACRFYQSQGCDLGQIHRFAYVDAPDVAGTPDVACEVMMVWYLAL